MALKKIIKKQVPTKEKEIPEDEELLEEDEDLQEEEIEDEEEVEEPEEEVEDEDEDSEDEEEVEDEEDDSEEEEVEDEDSEDEEDEEEVEDEEDDSEEEEEVPVKKTVAKKAPAKKPVAKKAPAKKAEVAKKAPAKKEEASLKIQKKPAEECLTVNGQTEHVGKFLGIVKRDPMVRLVKKIVVKQFEGVYPENDVRKIVEEAYRATEQVFDGARHFGSFTFGGLFLKAKFIKGRAFPSLGKDVKMGDRFSTKVDKVIFSADDKDLTPAQKAALKEGRSKKDKTAPATETKKSAPVKKAEVAKKAPAKKVIKKK